MSEEVLTTNQQRPPLSVSEERLPGFTKQSVEQWCGICTKFLQWERDRILNVEPSPAERQEHRQTLKWLLRLTKLIHSMTSDAEFPDRSAAQLLKMKLWQLDQSWKMIYEPMAAEEADRVLAQVFPGES